MSPPTIDKFLGEIWRIIQERNGTQLQEYLVIEPPFPPLYNRIVGELRRAYPSGKSHDALESKCKSFIAEYDETDDGGSRLSFISFMVKYFVFLRDVNVENLVETHDMLKALLNQCVLVLGSFMGLTVLPTVILLSKILAKLAIDLDKRPELVANLTRRESVGGEEAVERVTLVEGTANVIREAFKKCLSERSGNVSGVDSSGKPEGRRMGIYVTANLCLKLFFHCKKLRSAEQVFGNVYQQSPPLALFPAAQRVTFLCYLGRYLFANNHFFRAQLALQEAYNQCHRQFVKQRRLILIYLMTSNIILGRFPKPALWQRPEAVGLRPKFEPLCNAIQKGDLASFRRLVDVHSGHAEWFLQKRILLQVSNRCEVLIWRSLARRTFLLSGSVGDTSSKKAPTMVLQDMLGLAIHLERIGMSPRASGNGFVDGGAPHNDSNFLASDGHTSQSSGEIGYIDPDLADVVGPEPPLLPTMETVESIVASLVEQNFLHGFVSHSSHRFAITGAKNGPPLQVGFPKVWEVIKAREAGIEVPGWVQAQKNGPGGRSAGPGMVVNLSGARPAGAAPA